MRQGFYEESLALDTFDLPSQLSQSDIAVWQKLTQTSDYSYLSRYPEAQSALDQARTLAAASQPQLTGEAALRAGTLASLQWKLDRAGLEYHSALNFARTHKDRFLEIAALGSLGLVATRMEHYDESVDWNKQALQLAKDLSAMSSVARIEGNIGWSYYQVGDLEGALALYQQAAADSETAGLSEKRVTWLINAGIVHFDLGNFTAAEDESKRALLLSRQLKDINSTIDGLQNLALIALGKNAFAQAETFLSEASRLELSAPDHPRDLYTQLISAHLAAKNANLLRAEQLYSAILHDAASPASVLWEAQASLAQVHAEQGKNSLAEREFRDSIGRIAKARESLEHEDFRLSFLSSAIRFYDAYVNFLIAQKRTLDALKIADLSRAQALEMGVSISTGANPAKPSLGDVSAIAFRRKETLLFYWLGEQRSYLWAITPTSTAIFSLPSSAEVDTEVKAYRQSFLDPRDPLEAGNADGKKLYSLLVAPAEKLIPRNSRVVILPDGSLHSLNFETLIVPGPKPHYWIEDATITTANSLALLSRTSLAPPPKDGRLLVVGDALPASPDFPPLPQAGKEVGLLENYFGPAQRLELTGANATATQFLSSQPEKFAYLHFATHGTASRTRPLESAVILSPEGDSYKLYARDVVKHPLAAYLVTISACNGAGAKSYAGEGLVGLSWAFLRAGTHNVIAGLWEVSNASTPQLMDELYKGLHAGEDPATALRNAKLTLLHSNGNYRRPFYWAPFLLYSGW
jgi:CHAT domain-containing protein